MASESPELPKPEQKPPSKILVTYEKMALCLDNLESKWVDQKRYLEESRIEIKQLKKHIQKLRSKFEKANNKPKLNKKPHGFARPSVVTDELCTFMGRENGSLISRTDVTKSLIKYIADHQLQNPTNRRQILPDEPLYILFGDAARNSVIDYFTMQKYVNRHFPKQPPPATA